MNIPEILEKASALKIAVVGDMILDGYIDGVVDRISPEAPVPILKITGMRENPGGAGNVVENLKGLGVDVDFFYDEGRIPVKTRVMSGTHHLLRMDEEHDPEFRGYDEWPWANALKDRISEQKYNCVVISDYNKGVISESVAYEIISICHNNGIPVVVDTKNNFKLFSDATIVKCNQKEWASTGYKSEWDYIEVYEIDNLVITSGDKGIAYWGIKNGYETSGLIPGIPVPICDTCGAGDTVLAVLAVMTAIGEPIDQACELANTAAAEVCKHPGVYAIKKNDLLNLMK